MMEADKSEKRLHVSARQQGASLAQPGRVTDTNSEEADSGGAGR